MKPIDKTLTFTETLWQERIRDLRALLKDIRPKLVAAEHRLSEQLAEISSFEFLVRSRLEPLNRRMEKLDQEIAALQKEMRRLRENYIITTISDADDLYDTWRFYEEAGSAAAGEFRYHEPQTRPPRQPHSPDQDEKLRELYRQLARRFHPDFALNEADREYRTGVMMAINAAYTAGDLNRLQELANEPDPRRPHYSDEELAEALHRELEHCERRISEIEMELDNLHRHPSFLLKQRVDAAERSGRDLLEELAVDLRDRITERLAQRDVLQVEIDSFENGHPDIADDSFADAVYNLGLEQALGEEGDTGLAEWRDRNQDRLNFADSSDEEGWEALRKARDQKRR